MADCEKQAGTDNSLRREENKNDDVGSRTLETCGYDANATDIQSSRQRVK